MYIVYSHHYFDETARGRAGAPSLLKDRYADVASRQRALSPPLLFPARTTTKTMEDTFWRAVGERRVQAM